MIALQSLHSESKIHVIPCLIVLLFYGGTDVYVLNFNKVQNSVTLQSL